MATFNPPVGYTNPGILPTSKGVQRALFKYYGPYPVGQSVVLVDGHWTVVPTPSSERYVQGKDGVDFFLGGHIYTLTSGQVAALTADGFGSYIV